MLNIEKITEKLVVREDKKSPFSSVYTAGPLYRGYGNTIGNALRRVLLSSIPGFAIKGVKIEGVSSEFSTIEGVKESVVEILLNIKGVVLKTRSSDVEELSISAVGPKVITAGDLQHNNNIEIINPEHVIATLAEGVTMNMSFIADKGEGFMVANEIDKEGWPVGFLAVDALYSPVRKISYSVEETMVGKSTNFDQLTLVLETNGSVEAREIFSMAIELLSKYLNLFLKIEDRAAIIEAEQRVVKKEEKSTIPMLHLEDLDFSVRSYNCLKKAGIDSLEDLTRLSLKEVMSIKNFGKSSLNEVLTKLKELGIELS